MKTAPILLACLLATAVTAPAQAPKTQRERLGYALGAEIGSTFKSQGVDFDVAAFNNAVRDAMSGNRLQMTSSQIQETIMALNKSAGAAGAKPAVDTAALDKNKREGEAFLAANRSKPGVTALADGLQYKVLKEGTGPVPKASDTVTVKYRGTLINGTEFDNSDKHGDGTLTAAVTGDVIAGWTEALKLMKTGAKWQLYIPAALAYGEREVGTDIGPGSTLVFDVELVAIKK